MLNRFSVALFASLLLAISAPARGQEISDGAKLVDLHLTATFDNAKAATFAIGDTLADGNKSPLEFHEYLKRFLGEMNDIRAVLVLDANGKLIHDSFKFPAKDLDLSEREYFVGARDLGPQSLYIDNVRKGKTSGTAFLPISRAVYKEGKFIGVVNLVMTPARLLRQAQWNDCLYCYVEVVHVDGSILAQYPNDTDRPIDFSKSLGIDGGGASGSKKVRFHDLWADATWIRNDAYPVVTVFSEIEPEF